jgi:predicted metal-dependent phosphoesterase TrpH
LTRIDIHVHTTASACSIFPPRGLAALAVSMNLPVVVITNHHDCRGETELLKKILSPQGILLIPGVEITNKWGDFLVFGENLDEIQKRSGQFPRELLPRNDVAVVWAHPYRMMTESQVNAIKWEVAPYVDAIEVVNGNCLIRNNRANSLAQHLSLELEKPGVAGSDAHSDRMFFMTWTEFEEPVKSQKDFIDCIKKGRVSAGPAQIDPMRLFA